MPVHSRHDVSLAPSHPGWHTQLPAAVQLPWPLHTTVPPTRPGHSVWQSSPRYPNAHVWQYGASHCGWQRHADVEGACFIAESCATRVVGNAGCGNSKAVQLPWVDPPHRVVLTWQHEAGGTLPHVDASTTTHPTHGSWLVHTGAGLPEVTLPATNTHVSDTVHQAQPGLAAQAAHVCIVPHCTAGAWPAVAALLPASVVSTSVPLCGVAPATHVGAPECGVGPTRQLVEAHTPASTSHLSRHVAVAPHQLQPTSVHS